MKTWTHLAAGGALLAGIAGVAGVAMLPSGALRLPAWAQATASPPAASVSYQTIGWAALMPPDWFKRFRELNYGQMADDDPRVPELLREVEAGWDSAPPVAELDGRAVKLAGYIVPIEEVKGALSEFLLVPYLGACIHTPPPPANQIVHVKTAVPVKGFHAMDIVSISGTLGVGLRTSSMGVSGYAMDAAQVERYVPPPQKQQQQQQPAAAGD